MSTPARLLLGVIFSVTVFGPAAHALDRREMEVRDALKRFDRDPRTFMNEVPARVDSHGRYTPAGRIPVAPPAFTALRGRMRDSVRARGAYLHSRAESNDNPADLVDRFQFADLGSIDRAGLATARLINQPWSGSYWPLAEGLLAQRYSDPSFPATFDWKRNSDYILSHLNNYSSVETLSPAEKYDLLVGDSNWTLTRESLDEGGLFWRERGLVDGWMGICHGWAPASYMVPRPARAITVLAADGRTKVPFYPSDIKGLASLLWANGQFRTKSIGTRCDVSAPATDENGRIIDPTCFDENPGSWHLSIVNQVGVSRRSLVLDASYDLQVWNQPALAYSYTFFNPETREPMRSLREAQIRMGDFHSDKFTKYRAADAAYVVGIAMDLTYGSETSPNTQVTDTPQNDSLSSVRYLYDLELDAQGRIIGGEWYQNSHPDFLWTPTPNARAVSTGDPEIDRSGPAGWSGSEAFPASWSSPATHAARYGQPLAHAVEALLVLSAAGVR